MHTREFVELHGPSQVAPPLAVCFLGGLCGRLHQLGTAQCTHRPSTSCKCTMTSQRLGLSQHRERQEAVDATQACTGLGQL